MTAQFANRACRPPAARRLSKSASTGNYRPAHPHGHQRDTVVDRWGSLMIAGQEGDAVAYNLLMRELHVWLLRYFRRRLAPAAADDATQEVLLAVHICRDTYEARGPFGPWLTAIARNKWMDWLRRQYRQGDTLSIDIEIAIEDHRQAACSAILVHQLIDRLNPAQADVIRLVKLHGASIAEASRATGQSQALVKVNVHRGLKKIANFLEAGGPSGSMATA